MNLVIEVLVLVFKLEIERFSVVCSGLSFNSLWAAIKW